MHPLYINIRCHFRTENYDPFWKFKNLGSYVLLGMSLINSMRWVCKDIFYYLPKLVKLVKLKQHSDTFSDVSVWIVLRIKVLYEPYLLYQRLSC